MLLSSSGYMLLSLLGSLLLLSFTDHVNAEPKFISMDTQSTHLKSLQKRDAKEIDLLNFYNYVTYVNVTVGSPEQKISLVVDTANPDLWMAGPELSRANYFTSFNPKDSNTYKEMDKDFKSDFVGFLTEGDVNGKYFNDTLTLGDYKLENLTMAVASQAPANIYGVLGLGFSKGDDKTILDSMVAADLIKSRTYSLYLNSRKSEKGSILFGAYDKAKFTEDDMVVLNSQSDETFVVAVTGLSMVGYKAQDKFKRQSEESATGEASAADGTVSATDASATDASATDASATDASATDASATDASATDASANDASASASASTTDASATDDSATDASATSASATDAPATDASDASATDGSAAESATESSTGEASSTPDDSGESFGIQGPITAEIDSSCAVTMLPKDVVARLATYMGATQLKNDPGYVMPCETNVDAWMVFTLGDQKEIWVDVDELIIPLLDNDMKPMTYPGDKKTICGLGVYPVNDDETSVLGQTFLRSAYVHFDVDLKKIGFAHAIVDAKDTDIVPVENGSGVKGASSADGASITQSASKHKGAPGAGMADATKDVDKPATPATSLEGGQKTTLTGDKPHGNGGNKASATSSADSSSKTSKAAAAGATFEQSSLPVVGLSVCGSIMLIAALIL